MFDVTKIQNSLLGIVGFKQPYNPSYSIIDAENLISDSGIFVNDNPYAKIEFVKDSQDYVDISEQDFNIYLKDLQKTSISSICNSVFNNYDFLERDLLYKNTFNKIELETLPIGFVGFKIKVSKSKNIAFKINRVILDFDGTGDFDLILWNTGKKQPIYTKTISITTDNQVDELNWILNNSNTTYKGDYYLGYINKDLTVSPYKRDYETSNIITNYKNICVYPYSVVGHDSTTLFNLEDLDGLSETTGLNLDITVYEDFTDFILNNRKLFAKAISLDLTIKFMQVYISSLRSNANDRRAEDLYNKIMLEIEGTSSKDSVIPVKGLRAEMLGEISNIKTEVDKLKMGFMKSNQILLGTLT
jgi:hypothetical protein